MRVRARPTLPIMNDTIRFVLDGRLREIAGVDPNTTILEWLRGSERRCGTKEGCAEGDCGACSVVMATSLANATLTYRAVNACIQPIGMLDGKQLITVESLAGVDGILHPVQQAMVDSHASQCGFCTPGFVMSLFALRHRDEPASHEETLRTLAGNLCRCTGYRPILAAATRMRTLEPIEDSFTLQQQATSAQLATIMRKQGMSYAADQRTWHAPRTLSELQEMQRHHPSAVLVAGASDLGLEITKTHASFEALIALGEIAELQGIIETDAHLELGAAVTWAEAHAPLARHWPALDALIARFAGVQIRNVATLGGNIANASPIGDGAPAFLALDATLLLWRDGMNRELALRDFFLAYRKTALLPGEIITRIRLPKPKPGTRFAAYKISKRFDSDISAVCGCFRIERDARQRITAAGIAFGGMAAIPLRVAAAEEPCIGQEWSAVIRDAVAESLAATLRPIDDLRASAAYRRDMALALWQRFAAQLDDRLESHG